jgi:hypothetical protein
MCQSVNKLSDVSVNKFSDVSVNKFDSFCQILAESEWMFELWVIFIISPSVKAVNMSVNKLGDFFVEYKWNLNDCLSCGSYMSFHRV